MSDDQSHLDSKYFIDHGIYNCPFCNRRHVSYSNLGYNTFNWSKEKRCSIWRVKCDSCQKVSMHLTYKDILHPNTGSEFKRGLDLDEQFFHSVPTSFFVIDRRIPLVLRELITEAEGCAKMNYLTGASACTRKATYEFLALNKAEGANYDDKISAARAMFPQVDGELFEVLGHIKDMTSDQVHEQSWDAWESKDLYLILGALKAVLHEIYVVPDEKKTRLDAVRKLRGEMAKATNAESAILPQPPVDEGAGSNPVA